MSEEAERIKENIRCRQGMYLSDLTPEALDEAECMYIVAPLPDDFNARTQYLGDLLAQMCMNHKVTDDRLRMFLRAIATAFSYLLNSSSYQDGKLHSFDATELANKLQCIK
jgi:hypothetical protein